MKVSVVIPCFNQGRFLGEAIHSVRAQTMTDVEIIVVDDGSTDDTVSVANRGGARCLSQANQGQGAARNHGLRHAQGEYLVFLDADDRLLPHALETGLRHLEAHPDCALTAGRCLVFSEAGVRTNMYYLPAVTHDHYIELLTSNFIWMPASALFRTSVVRRMGGFKTTVTGAEDYDLYLRIAREHPIWCHEDFVAEYRQHDTNTSRRSSLMLRSTMKVMAAQRALIGDDPRARAAWRQGVRHWQQEYGDDTVRAIRKQIRAGDWRGTLPGLLALSRYYPAAFWRHGARKVTRVFRREKRETLEDVVG